MSPYNIVVSANESTVVADYVSKYCHQGSYQSEADLEREYIQLLQSQGYEHLKLHNEAALITNLRKQLELLNNYTFSDSEWNRFFNESIASSNEGIVEKTRKIQTDHVQNLKRDDGSTKNIYLIDKKNITITYTSHQPV
jgi:type I restriction enzyme R subunit